MTAAERIAKRVSPELEAAAAAENLASATAHVERALAILRPYRSLRHKIEKPAAPGATKETRLKDRNKRAAEIRAAVMERAGDACEWCGREGFVLEWAHVIDGNGDKQAHEAVETTAGVCFDCHRRGWHSDNAVRRMAAYRAAKEWALRHGFREALAAIEKKIAKCLEAA